MHSFYYDNIENEKPISFHFNSGLEDGDLHITSDFDIEELNEGKKNNKDSSTSHIRACSSLPCNLNL